MLRDFEAVMAYAKTPDGQVRNPKLMLAAGRELCRGLEVAIRLKEAIQKHHDLDRFHQAVIEEIAREAPEAAERLVARLFALTSEYAV